MVPRRYDGGMKVWNIIIAGCCVTLLACTARKEDSVGRSSGPPDETAVEAHEGEASSEEREVAAAEAEPGTHDAPDGAHSEATLHGHMHEHFVRVDRLQKAVIAGRLDDARAEARWLVEHEAHDALPPGWEPHIAAMRKASQSALDAKSVDDAAMAAASIAGTCGSCHANNGAQVRLGFADMPEAGDDLAASIRMHQWAADRMWDAVVSQSDELWAKGLDALATTIRREPEGLPEHGNFSELLERARAAKTPNDRVTVLGQHIAACARLQEESEADVAN